MFKNKQQQLSNIQFEKHIENQSVDKFKENTKDFGVLISMG